MISLYEYNLPFKTAFKTGASGFTHRNGIIIHFAGDVEALAEAAPLPGFSLESTEDVRRFLLAQREKISSFLATPFSLEEITPFLSRLPESASSHFALSMMALTILSKREGKPFTCLLKLPKNERPILVNEVIGLDSETEIIKQAETAAKSGVSVLKIKVSDSPETTAQTLKSIHKIFPQVRFRLDANRSWPLELLEQNCSLFSGLPVEYIEEPAPWSGFAGLNSIIKKTAFPIALDESVAEVEGLQNILHHYPGIHLVIKPTMFGNFLTLAETLSTFRSTFDKVVVTTALESSIGRTMVAAAASLIGDRTLAHGLQTARFLAEDLLPVLPVHDGAITFENGTLQSLQFKDLNQTFLKPIT